MRVQTKGRVARGAHRRSRFQAAPSLAEPCWRGRARRHGRILHSAESVLCVMGCRWDVQFIDTDGCANGWTGRCWGGSQSAQRPSRGGRGSDPGGGCGLCGTRAQAAAGRGEGVEGTGAWGAARGRRGGGTRVGAKPCTRHHRRARVGAWRSQGEPGRQEPTSSGSTHPRATGSHQRGDWSRGDAGGDGQLTVSSFARSVSRLPAASRRPGGAFAPASAAAGTDCTPCPRPRGHHARLALEPRRNPTPTARDRLGSAPRNSVRSSARAKALEAAL